MAEAIDDDLLQTDYYSLLNVGKEATADEISYAFRRLCKTYHPDKHTDTVKQKAAEEMFSRLKRAQEVLTDVHKRTIYNMYGEKGLEVEGLEVISRTKTPAEIVADYERLQREREDRKLEQRTNPKSKVVISVDASELLDGYSTVDNDDDVYHQPSLDNVEINGMTVFQTVDCPITTKDTAIIGVNLQARNGTGAGAFLASWRRIFSSSGWIQVDTVTGNGMGLGLKGFRQITTRCFGTSSVMLTAGQQKIVPSLSTTLAYQFDRHVLGNVTYTAGPNSNVKTSVIYSTLHHYTDLQIQVGVRNSFLALSYVHKIPEHGLNIRGYAKLGTTSIGMEYGVEKRISQFSHLRAAVSIMCPDGVSLKIRFYRGNQSFSFPIRLSEEVSPGAVFYGTLVPLVLYFAISNLVVKPFVRKQQKKDLERKKEEYRDKLSRKKAEAMSAVELMRGMVERCVEAEESKMGLVVIKALYGKLQHMGDGELVDKHCVDVTIPVQALVKGSSLVLMETTSKCSLPGFYDPCIGETKRLYILYKFRNQLHQVSLADTDAVRLPQRSHLIQNESSLES